MLLTWEQRSVALSQSFLAALTSGFRAAISSFNCSSCLAAVPILHKHPIAYCIPAWTQKLLLEATWQHELGQRAVQKTVICFREGNQGYIPALWGQSHITA